MWEGQSTRRLETARIVSDHTRLDELRRRVEKDPASIAFASFAEELRRAGENDEAARVCRAGLEFHPTYLSARVTLGRALIGLRQFPQARTELEYVLHSAPDNLLALKCMNELQERTGPAAADVTATTVEPAALAMADTSASTLLFHSETEPQPTSDAEAVEHPVLGELEGWQARIQAERQSRRGSSL